MANPRGNFNQFNNKNQINQPGSDGASLPNFSVNTINKDNIFQQAFAQNLIQPPAPQQPIAKPSNNDAINMQETQKLNTFLSSLGFQLGNVPQNINNTPPPGVLQPLPLVARAKEGVFLINDKEKEYLGDKTKLIYESATATLFNKDGSLLAFASQNVVGVYIFAEKKTMIFDLPNVIAIDFSNTSRYLTTIDRRENRFFISIFQPDPLRKLFEFETVRYKKETWPQLKFTENDELAFWAFKPTVIEVLNPRQNFQVVRAIETKPFDFFSISVYMQNLVIVCVSLEKSAGYYGHEGRIDIYKYSDLEKGDTAPAVSKIIDKAHEVTLFFSPNGQNLLLWAQTFTDKTGQSYYGEHMLLYLELNKKSLKKVPTYKGPIHDVAWNPNGLEFIVISGFMPAGSVLFDNLCVPKFEFGQHHKNTIKWSPLSRFVCLAGFGNLPGYMDIWDVYSLKQVGTCKSHSAVSCRWAPDGRRIMTGVFNPRLRVKNNYKIFKYNGELLNMVDYSESELYEVLWKPGKYQDRPASPPKQIEKPTDLIEKTESDKSEGEKKVFRPKGVGSFAAQIKADKSAKAGSGGRFLQPDETFGNDPNAEEDQKKEENGEKPPENKEEEQAKKPSTKIFRRNDRKSDEENKDTEEKANEVEQKKEPQ